MTFVSGRYSVASLAVAPPSGQERNPRGEASDFRKAAPPPCLAGRSFRSSGSGAIADRVHRLFRRVIALQFRLCSARDHHSADCSEVRSSGKPKHQINATYVSIVAVAPRTRICLCGNGAGGAGVSLAETAAMLREHLFGGPNLFVPARGSCLAIALRPSQDRSLITALYQEAKPDILAEVPTRTINCKSPCHRAPATNHFNNQPI
jgi:hypothetical protein